MSALARAPAVAERTLIPALGWAAVGVAWLAVGLTELGGQAALLHHHTLIAGGPPLGVSLIAFSAGWLVMVAAMMLPSTIGAVTTYRWATARRDAGGVLAFVGAFFVAWLAIGFVFFLGDVLVHRVAESATVIAAYSWLIEAGLVGFAGAYQFTPVKKRFLDACRHPLVATHGDRSGVSAGVAHAIDCLGSSGPMMLLMFAAGLANIWWMLGLTGVMVYEARGRNGHRVAGLAGGAFIGLALLAVTHAGLPAWAAP